MISLSWIFFFNQSRSAVDVDVDVDDDQITDTENYFWFGSDLTKNRILIENWSPRDAGKMGEQIGCGRVVAFSRFKARVWIQSLAISKDHLLTVNCTFRKDLSVSKMAKNTYKLLENSFLTIIWANIKWV